MKQQAYARRVFSGDGLNKTQIAKDVGYSPNVARSIVSHVEDKPGFHNAMAALAYESNNLALAAMHEFKARGFEDFTNNEMISALNAIAGAWAKFSTPMIEKGSNTSSTNKLRTVILNQIENQTVVQSDKPIIEQKPDLNF